MDHLVKYIVPFIFQIQVPFNKYFNIEKLKKCHKVILMEDFMKNLALYVWPPAHRIGIMRQNNFTAKSSV